MSNELSVLEKRAPAIKVNVHSATSCQPLPISWDASAGKAPWTLMIAPVNNVPYTFSVPKVSASDFPVAWIVPKVTANTQAIVAVADASGAYSGVSSLFTIASGSGSCPGMKQGLDFIWYPTGSNTRPNQCSDWGVTWAKEKGDGVQGQVSFTLLPENGQPVTVTGGSGNSGSTKFAIPFAPGTQFVAVANDGGKYGTGGVGTNPYTVSRARKAAKACQLSSTSGNGLPSPSQTLQSAATQSASGSSTAGGSRTSKTSSGAAAKSPTGTAQSAAADSSEKKSNSAGTAVGATFGVLAALGLIAFLVWWFRRRRAQQSAEKVWGGTSTSSHNLGSDGTAIGHLGNEKGGSAVSPWRFSASPYEPPQTTSRTSKWMQRASGVSGGNGGFRILSRGKNDVQQHSRAESLTTSVQPTMQQATFRNISYPQKTFDAASVASTHDQHFPRSPSPTLSQRNDVGNSNRSIHSTVPDTQLFPPPSARAFMSMDDSPYGIARHQQQQQLQHQQQQEQQQLFVSSPTAYSPNGDVRVRSPFEDPESAPPTPAKEYDVNRSVGAGVGAAGMPMQSSQSQQSYPLDSPTSEVRKGTLNEEPVRQMSPNPSGFSAQQRIPPPILSEVMMPERYMANSQRIQRTATEDEEDEGLPYL